MDDNGILAVLVFDGKCPTMKADRGEKQNRVEALKCMDEGDHPNQSSDILQHSQNRPTGDRWLKF